jgi:flavin prenyltransferase
MRLARAPVALVVSRGGANVIREELGEKVDAFESLARDLYSDDDLSAPIASGSRPTHGMAIVPCSGNTVAHVAGGLADTLITRAAQVHLKERRPLSVNWAP